MAVRLITASAGRLLGSVIQNPDQINFSGNTEATPHKKAISGIDLNVSYNSSA